MQQNNAETGDASPPELEVESFSKQAFQSLVTLTRLSHDLPRIHSDYDYYNSFPGFRCFSSKMQERTFSLIQNLSSGVTPVLSRFGRSTREGNSPPELEELFEKLIETNDAGLEQVGHLIDILNGVAPHNPVSPSYPPVVQTDPVPPPTPYSATLHSSPQLQQWNRLQYTAAPLNHWARGQMVRSNQIPKPQIFREGLDNFDTPFIPSLRGGVKPHALPSSAPVSSDHSSLHDLLARMRTQGTERLHPYFEELQEVNYPPSLFSNSEPEDPGPLDNHTYEFISTEERLDALVEQLKQCSEIAIDLEHHDYRSYLGFTCLLQITVKAHDYIIDPLRLGQSMHRLLDPLTNPAIIKVLHGADHDVQWLQRDFGLYLVGMFDTHQASVVLDLPKKSLAFLLNYCCSVKASKKFQMADWRARPLPQQMERYAREDTHYLLYIYHRMRNELIRRSTESVDLFKEVLDKSRMVCLKVYTKPVFNSCGYFKVLSKNVRSLAPIQREVCKELYAWRDRVARERDESCEYVLPGSMLFQITDKMPVDTSGILACCNPIPPVLSSCIDEVAMIYEQTKRNFIATGMSLYPPRPERRSRRLSSNDSQSSAKRANVLEVALEQSNDSTQFTPATSHSINIHEAIPTLKTLLISTSQDETKRKSLVSKVLATFQDPFSHFLMRPQDNGNSVKHDLQEPISHSGDDILEQDVIYLAPDKVKPSSHGLLSFSTIKPPKRCISPAVANAPEALESNDEAMRETPKRTKLQDQVSNEVIIIGKMSREEERKEGGNKAHRLAVRTKKNRKKHFNPNQEIAQGRREEKPFKPFEYSAVPPPYQTFPNPNRMHFNRPVPHRPPPPRYPHYPLPPPPPLPPHQYQYPPQRGYRPFSRGVPPSNRFPPPQQFAGYHGVPWPS